MSSAKVLKAEKSSSSRASSAANNDLTVQRSPVIAVTNPPGHKTTGVADKPMRMPEGLFVQRKCATCGEKEQIHRKPLVASITPFIQAKGAVEGNINNAGDIEKDDSYILTPHHIEPLLNLPSSPKLQILSKDLTEKLQMLPGGDSKEALSQVIIVETMVENDPLSNEKAIQAVAALIQNRINRREELVLDWSIARVLGEKSQFEGYPYPEGSKGRNNINEKRSIANTKKDKRNKLYEKYFDAIDMATDQILKNQKVQSPFEEAPTNMWSASPKFDSINPFKDDSIFKYLGEQGGNKFYKSK